MAVYAYVATTKREDGTIHSERIYGFKKLVNYIWLGGLVNEEGHVMTLHQLSDQSLFPLKLHNDEQEVTIFTQEQARNLQQPRGG